jgi:hypothetical protein
MKKIKYAGSSKQKKRSQIQYFDDDMNPVSRDRATWAIIRNFDENGILLFEAEGFIE